MLKQEQKRLQPLFISAATALQRAGFD